MYHSPDYSKSISLPLPEGTLDVIDDESDEKNDSPLTILSPFSDIEATIDGRSSYLDNFSLSKQETIVLMKDVTVKNAGFIYYNDQTHKVYNDGMSDNKMNDFYFWEIIIANFKNLQKHRSSRKLMNAEVVTPLIYIKNVGNSCYLRCHNIVNVKCEESIKYDDWGSDYPTYETSHWTVADLGSKFEKFCNDKQPSKDCLWVLHNVSSNQQWAPTNEPITKYNLNMYFQDTNDHTQFQKNQFLTFGNKVHLHYDSYSLPKVSRIQFFENQKDGSKEPIIPQNTDVAKQRKLKHRHHRYQSSKNLNFPISGRIKYRHTFTFDRETCIVLMKDVTLKNQSKQGFIYYNEHLKCVCNDGMDDSILTNYFLWEITMHNIGKLKKSKYQNRQRIISIRNLGTQGYLRSFHKIKFRMNKYNPAKSKDLGSQFRLMCNQKQLSDACLWVVNSMNVLYVMSMVKSMKNGRAMKDGNQYLTFGKKIIINNELNTFRYPKHTKLRIFK